MIAMANGKPQAFLTKSTWTSLLKKHNSADTIRPAWEEFHFHVEYSIFTNFKYFKHMFPFIMKKQTRYKFDSEIISFNCQVPKIVMRSGSQ